MKNLIREYQYNISDKWVKEKCTELFRGVLNDT